MALLHTGGRRRAARRRLHPYDIELIDIDIPGAVCSHGGWQAERPLAPIGAQINVMYTVAVAELLR